MEKVKTIVLATTVAPKGLRDISFQSQNWLSESSFINQSIKFNFFKTLHDVFKERYIIQMGILASPFPLKFLSDESGLTTSVIKYELIQTCLDFLFQPEQEVEVAVLVVCPEDFDTFLSTLQAESTKRTFEIIYKKDVDYDDPETVFGWDILCSTDYCLMIDLDSMELTYSFQTISRQQRVKHGVWRLN